MTDKSKPVAIRKQRERLDIKIKQCYAQISALQEQCDHSGELLYKYWGGSGGYYDPPEYWTEWYCKDCGKRWNTKQDRSFEQQHPNAVRIK